MTECVDITIIFDCKPELPTFSLQMKELIYKWHQKHQPRWNWDWFTIPVDSPLLVDEDVYYISSRFEIGEAINDEWLMTKMILDISKSMTSVSFKLLDTDGDYILIECADLLPDWACPDACGNRVFIRDGSVRFLMPPSSFLGEVNGLRFADACRQLKSDDSLGRFILPPVLHARVDDRIRQAAQGLDSPSLPHVARVAMPWRVASLLSQLCPARYPAGEGAQLGFGFASSRFPCEEHLLTGVPLDGDLLKGLMCPCEGNPLVGVAVTFSRLQFARLLSLRSASKTLPRLGVDVSLWSRDATVLPDASLPKEERLLMLELGGKLVEGLAGLLASRPDLLPLAASVAASSVPEGGDWTTAVQPASWSHAWMGVGEEEVDMGVLARATGLSPDALGGGLNVHLVKQLGAALEQATGLGGLDLEEEDFDDPSSSSEGDEQEFDEEEFAEMKLSFAELSAQIAETLRGDVTPLPLSSKERVAIEQADSPEELLESISGGALLDAVQAAIDGGMIDGGAMGGLFRNLLSSRRKP